MTLFCLGFSATPVSKELEGGLPFLRFLQKGWVLTIQLPNSLLLALRFLSSETDNWKLTTVNSLLRGPTRRRCVWGFGFLFSEADG